MTILKHDWAEWKFKRLTMICCNRCGKRQRSDGSNIDAECKGKVPVVLRDTTDSMLLSLNESLDCPNDKKLYDAILEQDAVFNVHSRMDALYKDYLDKINETMYDLVASEVGMTVVDLKKLDREQISELLLQNGIAGFEVSTATPDTFHTLNKLVATVSLKYHDGKVS